MDAGPRHQAGEPDLRSSTATILRLIAGWACTALGLLNLAMGLDPAGYAVFHLVMLATGIALLALGLLRKRPGRSALIAAAATAGLGLLASGLVQGGFPFRLNGFGFAVADLFFWCCAGFFSMLAVTVVRPDNRSTRVQHRTPAAGRASLHAEPRGRHSAGPADGGRHSAPPENVRGLP